jgi:hypothetical protein
MEASFPKRRMKRIGTFKEMIDAIKHQRLGDRTFAIWSQSKPPPIRNAVPSVRGTPQSLAHAAKQSRRGEQGLPRAKALLSKLDKGELQIADVQAKTRDLFEAELAKLN